MKTLIVLLTLLGAPLAAQITNLRVLGTTATQAAVAYTAPDGGACSVAVSTTADSSGNPTAPYVHDVDTSLFAGADQDSRADNISNGRSRQVIIGRRRADLSLDGYSRYSRALQTNTPHYGKITCGTATALFTFQTTNIPLGLGAADPYPTDANFPGLWAAPYTTGSIGEVAVDPLTGVAIKRSTPSGYGFGTSQYANYAFDIAYNQGQQPCDSGGPWVTPCNAYNASGYASATPGSGWLVLRKSTFTWPSIQYGQSAIQLQFAATAYSSASGDSADIALSANGGATPSTPITTVSLPTTAGTITAGTNNPTGAGISPWLLQSWPRISPSYTTGNVTVSAASVTRTSGGTFSYDWVGGRIRLSTVSTADACTNGTEATILSVDNGTSLTLTTSPGSFSYYCASNAAIMIRPHPGNTGTMYLGAAKYTTTTAEADLGTDGGFVRPCSDTLYSGGYVCFQATGGGMLGLVWVNATTGDTAGLGNAYVSGGGVGADSWLNGVCPGGAAMSSFDNNELTYPTWYCAKNDSAGHRIVLRVQYTGPLTSPIPYNDGTSITRGPCTSAAQTMTCSNAIVTNMTPASLSMDAGTQEDAISGFTHDSAQTCGSGPFSNGGSIPLYGITCKTAQNAMGYIAAFTPGDGQPSHAGQPVGPRIVGVMDTWTGSGGTANRWAGFHSVMDYGPGGFLGLSTENIGTNLSAKWATTPQVTTNTPIPSTGSDCTPYPPYTGNNCIALQINANGGSYEPYYWSGAGGQGQTPGFPSIAKVGDLFVACKTQWTDPNNSNGCSPATGEALRLISKGSNGAWVFYRNALIYPISPGDYSRFTINDSTTKYLVPWNGAQVASWQTCGGTMIGGQLIWDPVSDPVGQATIGDSGFCNAHSSVRNTVSIEASGPDNYTTAYRIRRAPDIRTLVNTPFFTTTANSFFHGVRGTAYPNTWQAHPTSAGDNVSTYESQAGFDVRPHQGNYLSTPNNNDKFVHVTGNLWKMTPSVVTDADNYTYAAQVLHRKVQPTAASSGRHPLLDVSAPAPACVINGTDAHLYQYAVVRNDGECYTGSHRGEVYVNAPAVVYPYCYGNNVTGVNSSSNDLCVEDAPNVGNGIVQFSTLRADSNAQYQRVLVKGMTSAIRAFNGQSGVAAYPAGFVAYSAALLDGFTAASGRLVELPPFPAIDSVARNDFVPIQVQLKPPAGLGVNNAIVEFGYPDYGGNCTTRNETCVANGAAIGSVPFQFAGENPAGAACAAGCTIAIPAVSQRILYYRVKYRDASNNVVSVMPYQVVATP